MKFKELLVYKDITNLEKEEIKEGRRSCPTNVYKRPYFKVNDSADICERILITFLCI
jgi:hypothetical protein